MKKFCVFLLKLCLAPVVLYLLVVLMAVIGTKIKSIDVSEHTPSVDETVWGKTTTEEIEVPVAPISSSAAPVATSSTAPVTSSGTAPVTTTVTIVHRPRPPSLPRLIEKVALVGGLLAIAAIAICGVFFVRYVWTS